MPENTVKKETIDALIANADIQTLKLGVKTTVVFVTLANGFTFLESSSCVDPANYDHELGRDICLERIKSKIWAYEGYRLQDKLAEERMREHYLKTVKTPDLSGLCGSLKEMGNAE